MRDHNDGLVTQHAPNTMFKYVLSHVRIDSGQDVIQQVHVSLRIHRAGQAHPLLLPSGKIDPDSCTRGNKHEAPKTRLLEQKSGRGPHYRGVGAAGVELKRLRNTAKVCPILKFQRCFTVHTTRLGGVKRGT